MSKKLYTQEQLDHAIDYALKIGDHTLDELYGRKNYIEKEIKRIENEYKDVLIKIDELERKRVTGEWIPPRNEVRKETR